MRPLTATFVPNAEGRVLIDVDVICSDKISYETIVFKLDTGSDFTVLNNNVLKDVLGYSDSDLRACPKHDKPVITASGEELFFRYIRGSLIRIDGQRMRCDIYFCVDKTVQNNLLGANLLKNFKLAIDNDANTVHFIERQTEVLMGKGETPLQLFELE